MAELPAHEIRQSEHKWMVWILIINWPVPNIWHKVDTHIGVCTLCHIFGTGQLDIRLQIYTLFEITPGAMNYTPIYSKKLFVGVQNVSSYKTSSLIKFLHIQNFSTFKISLHDKKFSTDNVRCVRDKYQISSMCSLPRSARLGWQWAK